MSDDPVLRAREAFDAGNFAEVRAITARALADGARTEAERAALETLRARTEPGRAALLVFLAGAALALSVISYWLIAAHRHPHP